ncbi:phage regulatory CII family protein [uncultured Phascolarctobacterium sp.]|uniref:phage regulatory CII family protein n=1 Tax=uncultured Phascolarctobacterium sp. TaxID=512296 RepID=UPI00345BF430
MADLKNMTGTEAFQLAKDESALTIEEIAERLTVSPSVIKRYLNAGDNYLPSLEMIPRLCSTLGNNILLRWLEAQVEAEENAVPPAQNRTEVLTSVVRAGAALGNVQRILAETQVIVPHNARKLRSALNDVITECRVAKESLQPLAARKDLAECTHILCMKKASLKGSFNRSCKWSVKFLQKFYIHRLQIYSITITLINKALSFICICQY